MALTEKQKAHIGLAGMAAGLGTVFALIASAYVWESRRVQKYSDEDGPRYISQIAFTNGTGKDGCKHPGESYETVKFDFGKGSLSGAYYTQLADQAAANSCLKICSKSDTQQRGYNQIQGYSGAIVAFSLEKNGKFQNQTIYGKSCEGLNLLP